MAIQFYNYLTRKKEVFQPIQKGRVGIYSCGPTVYDFPHIGNLRTGLFEDFLRRTLKFNGLKVRQVRNITDVDDKIIKAARTKNQSIKTFVKPYIRAFFSNIEALNIEKAEVYPRATEHIKEMVALIKKLLKKGYAYRAEDNSIYFDISKFKAYGRLSKIGTRREKAESRILADEYKKEEISDFVLWKARKPGEPFWRAPFGEGRPGWHIECSAMSIKYLGECFDIHTGAINLLFPHHENEIAQSEAALGKKFVNYFIEGEHLLIQGEKMSKSLGNTIILADLKKRGFDPLSFRYLCLTAHYRSQLNFTWKSLEAAQNALENLRKEVVNLAMRDVRQVRGKASDNAGRGRVSDYYRSKFLEAINDDLDTPRALSIIWKFVDDPTLAPKEKLNLLIKFDQVFGLGLEYYRKVGLGQIKKIAKLKPLLKKRAVLRKEKKWKEADEIRKKIEKMGYLIEDVDGEPIIKIKSL